ncbi:MAG TPA: outer membrane beta-barrel protein [Bacteroidales bacterium]|nr:outer membrane beta-barrel protein [Bacteroidales bacterium]
MKYIIAFGLLSATLSLRAQAQQLSGTILDDKARPLASAVAVLLNPSDSTMQYFSVTGGDGRFELRNVKAGPYVLQVSLLGFNTLYRPLSVPFSAGDDLGDIILREKVFGINEVKVTSDRIPLRIKKDTIEYDAKAYKIKPDGVAEDILKKLPGIEVDRSGNIKAMGENVRNVLVDGKEFFGSDPKVATRNLPADAINKVQLFNRKSDESRFTGVDDGERNPTLNFVLEDTKKAGIFGDVEAGGGTGEHFTSGLKAYRFTKKSQLAALGMFNNINRFGFSVGDYITFAGGIGSLTGNGTHLTLGGDDRFPVNFGQQVYGSGSNGAAGLNYSVFRSDYDRFFVSYLGNGSSRRTTETSLTRNFTPDGSFRTEESSNEIKRDSAHRVNFGWRYRFGDNQSIILNGGVDYNSAGNPLTSQSGSFLDDVKVNELNRSSSSFTSGLSGNGEAIYLLKMNEGTTILRTSLRSSFTGDYSRSGFTNNTGYFDPYQELVTSQYIRLRTEVKNISGGVSLTQRITKNSVADISLKGGLSSETMVRRQGELTGDTAPDSLLSPNFRKDEKFLRPGLTWKRGTSKSQFSLSLAGSAGYYTTSLNGDPAQRNDYFYITPGASWEYDYRTGRRLMFNYTTSVNTPSVSQMLPVVDNQNPLALFTGNRGLRPEVVHDARFTWWLFDQFSFTTLMASVNARYIRDKINFTRTIDDQLRQNLSFVNVNSDWTAGGDIDFSTPVKPLGMKINLVLSEGYNRGINIVNSGNNINSVFSHRISLTLDNRKKDKWDISTGAALNITDSRYSVQRALNNVYHDLSWFSDISFTPSVHFSIKATAELTSYSAISYSGSSFVPIVGAEASYFFMKNQRASFVLAGVDLLNRNTGIQRISDLNYLTEKRSSVLGRYVLLTFRYRLNKVGDNGNNLDIKIKNSK